MNPRQRRGLLLLILSAVGAIAVFFSVLSFIADVNARAGNFITVVSLARDVEAYQPVTAEDLELREVPERWASEQSIRDARDIVGLVPLNDMGAGTFASEGMFIDRPGIEPGNREIAIMVDAETGVAGKVNSGDRVDIIATFPGEEEEPPSSQLWAQGALVIDVGLPEEITEEDGRGGFTTGQGVPITFALPTEEALRVAYGESFSVKLRLALRARNDDSTLDEGQIFAPANLTPTGDN
ncbi:Flp pilus assembly protein CpaB [Serinicoccus kebangsaanensis]|uniref:Flp pilus assembly protein CpaB n=1 Tax=Serinicoccus kebangsaanensis TaxID=2602069 RepID=UPI00124CF774|nr:Flp pilus assembly protein CpaB [Serinicoccus kebangsaanensis]